MRAALVLGLALALAAAPGEGAGRDKIRVVTTTTDLRALVQAVGGEHVVVESIATPEQDPHSIELKPAQLARLRRAELVVRIGLDHEPWLARVKTEAMVLDASRGVRLLQTETPRLRVERRAHVHAYGNTHYWLDPQNAHPITAAIVEALARLNAADRALFEANRAGFLQQLDARMKAWSATLAPLRGVNAVVIHDTWAYFADRFGIAILAAAEPTPGVPPAPAELAALFKRMREAGVQLVIADPHSNASLVRHIAERGGARPVTLLPSVGADPAASDYIALFDMNVQRLAGALK
jgi:ABC-type Zn uptake system ZnuABC Zn-binding protein ZnuA